MKPPTEPGLPPGVFNSIPNPIFVLDKKRCFVLANQAFCDLVSMPAGEFMGKPVDLVLPPEACIVFKGKPGSANNSEIHFRSGDGSINPYHVSVRTTHDDTRELEVVTLDRAMHSVARKLGFAVRPQA